MPTVAGHPHFRHRAHLRPEIGWQPSVCSPYVLFMGQNLTRSPRLQVVLATPLSNYRNKPWVLVCAGRGCSAEVDLPLERLQSAYASTTSQQVLNKLRCQRCGEPPTGVLLQTLPTNAPGNADAMTLIGPGAFG